MKLTEIAIAGGAVLMLWVAATPHVRNADTASDLATAKSRMQSLGLGIEAYRTDYGEPVRNGRVAPNQEKWWDHVPNLLTTPVAYLSDSGKMIDPFKPVGTDLPAGERLFHQRFQYTNHIMMPPIVTGALQLFNPATEEFFQPVPANIDAKSRKPISWSLMSFGPDAQYGPISRTGPLVTSVPIEYDPSNGVLSVGELVYTSERSGEPFGMQGILLAGPETHFGP